MQSVAVLFARKDTVYREFPDVDIWDARRDARKWPGGCPIIAHPPCAQWCRLSHFSKRNDEEKALAPWAVSQIRKWGGILEHPYKSKLWNEMKLPLRSERDEFGGYTIAMPQFWFGHPANKATWFYIVGCKPEDFPEIPFKLGRAEMCVTTSRGKRTQKEMKKSERTRTHFLLAEWLIAVARKCRVGERGAEDRP